MNDLDQFVTIDFETRCRVPLRSKGGKLGVGLENYVSDPSFEILCLGWKVGEKPARLWVPPNQQQLEPLYKLIRLGCFVFAHNAGFEKAVWEVMVRKYGAPLIRQDVWRDTAAMAAVLAFPRSLKELGSVLQLENQKDEIGHRDMLYLSQPLPKNHRNKYGGAEFATTKTHPDKYLTMYRYCVADVECEHELLEHLLPLSKAERKVFLLDMKINERGIPIDVESVKAAIDVNEQIEKTLLTELSEITDGKVTSVNQNAKMLAFVNDLGVNIDNLQKETIRDLFDSDEKIDALARRVLEIRQSIGLASTAKYRAMLASVGRGDRIRHTLLYHGATTGRWTGKGVQFHNLPSRGLVVAGDDRSVSTAVNALSLRDPVVLDCLYGDTPGTLKALIRPMVKAPPGRVFYVADFAQIEARTLAWLSEDAEALTAYRDGRDSYVELAAKIYEKPVEEVTGSERFMGKSATLGLGYGMGADKFRLTLEKQGVEITNDFAVKVVSIYRRERGLVPSLWRVMHNTAEKAIETPGKIFQAGRYIKFKSSHERLWMILPCGRKLSYNRPEVKRTEVWIVCERMGDGSSKFVSKHASEASADKRVSELEKERADLVGVKVTTVENYYCFPGTDTRIVFRSSDIRGKWVRETTYGAKLVENACQAISRDFLVDSMFRLERADFETIFTVHDEIILECDDDYGSPNEVRNLMEIRPPWAPDFPLEVEVFKTKRYRK